jgi:hypothetical protein
MDILQQALDHELEELPRRFLETLLLKKIRAAGITATKTLSHELARHILSGNNEPSTYRDGRSNRVHITITVEEDDIKEIVSKLDSFGETQLDRLIETVADPIVTRLLKTLKSGWADEYIFQQAELSAFRARLENRWGIPLSQLRMLLTISREWCQETCNHDTNLKIDNKIHLNDLLVRQLVRASQVADEIICFLENGFADGAMARWRTLHETAIVASVISQHGEDIVERYIAHEAVESKRALEKYDNCHEQLGYKPISEGERKTIIKSYEAAIAKIRG